MSGVHSETYWVPYQGQKLATQLAPVILTSTALYIPSVLTIQFFMRNRKPFRLKEFTFIWNLTSSILSFIGAVTMIYNDPFIFFQTCAADETISTYSRAALCFFCLTKGLEFVDTIILAFKQKPLSFLHLWHHLSVALYCWHAQYVDVPFAHHFAVINMMIHAVMYFYYAVTGILPGHPLVRRCRPYITLSQLLQMFVGTWLSYAAIKSDETSESHKFNGKCALCMYLSYAYLFGDFYLSNYHKNINRRVVLTLAVCQLLGFYGCVNMFGNWREKGVASVLINPILLITMLLTFMTVGLVKFVVVRRYENRVVILLTYVLNPFLTWNVSDKNDYHDSDINTLNESELNANGGLHSPRNKSCTGSSDKKNDVMSPSECSTASGVDGISDTDAPLAADSTISSGEQRDLVNRTRKLEGNNRKMSKLYELTADKNIAYSKILNSKPNKHQYEDLCTINLFSVREEKARADVFSSFIFFPLCLVSLTITMFLSCHIVGRHKIAAVASTMGCMRWIIELFIFGCLRITSPFSFTAPRRLDIFSF